MKAFEEIENLMKEKSYGQLSSDERKLVDQELTAETYEELRTGMYQLKGEKLKVRKDVKSSLMAEFKGKETTGLASILTKRIPAYGLVIPLLLLVVLFIYKPVTEVLVINDRIVEVTLYDTVEVVRTDTLWRDKIVKVPQLVYVTKEDSKDEQPTIEVVNRSLGDHKEILDLVVRGD